MSTVLIDFEVLTEESAPWKPSDARAFLITDGVLKNKAVIVKVEQVLSDNDLDGRNDRLVAEVMCSVVDKDTGEPLLLNGIPATAFHGETVHIRPEDPEGYEVNKLNEIILAALERAVKLYKIHQANALLFAV